MDVIINGESLVIPEDIKTVNQLVEHMELESPVIIAEHNGTILKQNEHTATEVSSGDKIEFVQFVGGG